MTHGILLSFALSLSALSGCSTSGKGKATTERLAPPADVVCNALSVPAHVVPELQVPESLPVATGGAMTSGTWVMTARTVYTGVGGATGPTGITEAQTALVTVRGDTATAEIGRSGVPASKNLTLTFTPGSTEFIVKQTCPGNCNDCGGSQPYTVTPTTFTIFGDGPVKNRSRTFTRNGSATDTGVHRAGSHLLRF